MEPQAIRPTPPLQIGSDVWFYMAGRPTDEDDNPRPLAAKVVGIQPDGKTVDLVVFGSGTRQELAGGKGLFTFRGLIRHESDRGTEPRYWAWPTPGPTIVPQGATPNE